MIMRAALSARARDLRPLARHDHAAWRLRNNVLIIYFHIFCEPHDATRRDVRPSHHQIEALAGPRLRNAGDYRLHGMAEDGRNVLIL